MKRAFLALVVLVGFLAAPLAHAQNQDIVMSGSNYYVTLATNKPWVYLQANYIFTPQSPNVGACLFVENLNPTNSHALTIAAYQTGDPSLDVFQTEQNLWNTSQIVANFTSVGPASMKSLYINMTAAANVAVVITGTGTNGGTPDTANVFLVQTTAQQCGSAMAGIQVQGSNPTGSSSLLINPVLIGGQASNTLEPVAIDSLGHLILSAISTPNGFNFTGGATMLGTGSVPWVLPAIKSTANVVYGGTTSSSTWRNGVDTWHTAIATAAGNTTIWPAVSAEAWHAVCISVDVTANASLASAGIEKITLEEASSALPIEWDVFIPATAATSGPGLYHSDTCGQPPGLTATALNDALNVNLATALSTGEVVVRVGGMQY